MTKVSIIIPIYNKEKYLEKTINSILNQSMSDFEIILINDGSTDDSEIISKKLKKHDSRIRYFYQKNSGVSVARNNGIEKSSGEYISFIDADDEWNATFLEKLLDAIGDSNVCYTGHYIRQKGRTQKGKIKFKQGFILENYLLNKTTPNTNSWLIRRDYIEDFSFRFAENLNYGEDMLFFANILLNDDTVKYVPDYLTTYNTDVPFSLTENNLNLIDKDIIWMKKLGNDIEMSNLTHKNKIKTIRALETYRLPASIIYRIFACLNVLSRDEVKKIYMNYYKYIDKIKFSNGFRSFKLFLYYLLLKFKL